MLTKKLKIKDEVKRILAVSPATRDSDKELYIAYAVAHGDYELANALRNSKLPSFESIGRARRKAQEQNPELRGSEDANKRRAEQIEEWQAFNRCPDGVQLGIEL